MRWREATAEATARLVEEAPFAPLAPARQSGWSAQLGWCLWRSWRQSGGFAAPSLLAMRVVGSVVPGLAFGCIWFDLPAGRGSLKARVGLLQVLANFVGTPKALDPRRSVERRFTRAR